MRKYTYILLFTLVIASCKKATISTADVLTNLTISPSHVDADGSSVINIAINVNNKADVTDRKIVFIATAGTFATSGSNTITIDPQFENTHLIARATLKAPLSPGYIVVSAQPNSRTQYREFIVKDSILANFSYPSSIQLTASAFGVSTGFAGEVSIIGVLKNNKGKNVSIGNKVMFSAYLKNGGLLDGRFRGSQAISDANSQVSAVYSPGYVPPGTDFYLKAVVLDTLGNLTAIRDSVLLSVTE